MIKTVLRSVEYEEIQREAARRSFIDIARRVRAIVHQQKVRQRLVRWWRGY
ncbi:hypothetical protein ACIBAI_19515 [Streptomyces sp. NPDC051041]|uniref:hypothetical protein n=1 Tax=Streptomyces sp. NPDC051041 TaxID=3365640 RepID=UPI0037B7B3C8